LKARISQKISLTKEIKSDKIFVCLKID